MSKVQKKWAAFPPISWHLICFPEAISFWVFVDPQKFNMFFCGSTKSQCHFLWIHILNCKPSTLFCGSTILNFYFCGSTILWLFFLWIHKSENIYFWVWLHWLRLVPLYARLVLQWLAILLWEGVTGLKSCFAIKCCHGFINYCCDCHESRHRLHSF